MEGVEAVSQLDQQRFHWRAKIGGRVEEWEALITEQHPDERIAWKNTTGASLPSTRQYWTTLRMMRSGHWEAVAGVCDLATATLRTLPPPADGILSLVGESTLKDKRDRQPPLGAYAPS